MTICTDCGATFEYPGTYETCNGMEGPYTETVDICPECKCEDLADARQCQYCGEWFDENDLTRKMCDDCAKLLIEMCRGFVEDGIRKLYPNRYYAAKVGKLMETAMDGELVVPVSVVGVRRVGPA